MARGLPSMTALLGLIAVAGYQNRDKIAEMLGNRGAPAGAPGGSLGGQTSGGGLGGLLDGLTGGGGGRSAGGVLGGGLGELVDRFRGAGHGETVDSWVGPGSNRDIAASDLERALGPDTLDELTRHTGLDRSEILARLARDLPRAVDGYTPNGRLPREDEF
jgi:uncharacterized protein YidB (DUF937 family)